MNRFNTVSKNFLTAGFIILLAGGWMMLGARPVTSAETAPAKKTIYQCSMHPQVISDKPGNCPICGMKLTRVETAGQSSGARKILFYRNPMRPDITSRVPMKDEMGMDYIPVYEDQAGQASSVPGRAQVHINPEQQQMIGVKFAEVKEMPLAVKIRTLGRVGYDHDVYEAINQYQEAAVQYRNLRGSPSTIIKERLDQLHELSMVQLRLFGLSDMQIEEFTHAGQLPTYYRLPHDHHWLYADLYEFDSSFVHPGDRVMIKAPSFPGEISRGTVRSVDTLLQANSRIIRARIEVDAEDKPLLPGTTVDIDIEASLGTHLAVPISAVFDTGDQQIVFVEQGDSHFEPRQIRVGHEAGDYYPVVEGLKEGERVVNSATFLIDSESRLRAASLPQGEKA